MANVVKYKKTGDINLQGGILLDALTASNVPNTESGKKTLFLDSADTTLKTKDSSGTVAAIGGSSELPVTALGTSGTQTINRTTSDKWTLTPASAVTLATSGFTDMQSAMINITDPNSLVSYPAEWIWKTALPIQPEDGIMVIKLTAVVADTTKIIAEAFYISGTNTAWKLVLNEDDYGNENYSVRILIPASEIVMSGTGCYVSFKASSVLPFAFAHASIVQASTAGSHDGITSPTALAFGGNAGYSGPAGSIARSDLCNLAIDETKDYLVTLDFGAADASPSKKASASPHVTWYGPSSGTIYALEQNIPSWSSFAGVSTVTKIEVSN